MARYIERAENIARIVDVNLQLLLDLRNLDEKRLAAHWLPIVQATGDDEAFFKLHPRATGQAVTEFLVFQTENPNSIVQSICAARENARMVRDQITAGIVGGIEPPVSVRPLAAGAQSLAAQPQRIFSGNQSRLAALERHRQRDVDPR